METKTIDIKGPGGIFPGYLALPDHSPKGGVVVVQEIFGVNEHIRAVTERVAAAGFVALAPHLYWRVDPQFSVGYTQDDVAKGFAVRKQTDDGDAVKDVEASIEVLKAQVSGKGIGVMGFCWGGLITYLSSARLPIQAAASYYGGGITDQLSEASAIKCPIQFHFGEIDHSISLEQVEQVRTAMKDHSRAEIFLYANAHHGFNCDLRASYDADSAALAWQRSMGLFESNLA